jgi:hypothetical protein
VPVVIAELERKITLLAILHEETPRSKIPNKIKDFRFVIMFRRLSDYVIGLFGLIANEGWGDGSYHSINKY